MIATMLPHGRIFADVSNQSDFVVASQLSIDESLKRGYYRVIKAHSVGNQSSLKINHSLLILDEHSNAIFSIQCTSKRLIGIKRDSFVKVWTHHVNGIMRPFAIGYETRENLDASSMELDALSTGSAV